MDLNVFVECVVLFFDDFEEEILFLYFVLLFLLLCFGLLLSLFLFYKFG